VTGIDIRREERIHELNAFERHVSEYGVVVYSGLRCDITFDGQVATPQRINLLYDWTHYHVITEMTASVAKISVPLV
jgi:hypothetical protein